MSDKQELHVYLSELIRDDELSDALATLVLRNKMTLEDALKQHEENIMKNRKGSIDER
jgi:hypothetical protein